MTRLRFLLLLIGSVLILLLALWLLGTATQIYSTLMLTAPWLARVFIALFCGMVIILIGGLGYYAYLFLRPTTYNRSANIQISTDPTQVAVTTLDAIQQQVDQIQDEIAQEAFVSRRQSIQRLMDHGDFQVVIFGVGSTGKTSTVNAVLGRIAGDVSAPMGTTTDNKVYRLELQGVGRKILLTDTPGILEASVWGDQREEQARQLATEADVLVFVVDNDLLQTEYDVLRRLVAVGKRSLLILNKSDLYTDDERDQILGHLRHRVRSLLAPEDVVAIAANPAAVVLETGDRFTPEPDVGPLLQRVGEILRDEGETLMAENILLQSQRLGDDARQLLDRQRQEEANAIIEKYQWVSGGVISVMPLPGIDFLATAAINAQMVMEIGKVYGCEVNRDRAKELAVSLAKTLGGLGLVKGAFELWSTTLKLNIATVLIGQALQGVTGAYLTRIAGKSFIEYFRQEQDWGDGGITDVVQEQFQLNRRDEFIQSFVQQAMTKIVFPLTTASNQGSKNS